MEDADLDLLLSGVYCTADDLLPERPANARRKLTDAEIVTLCVGQVSMGIPSDRRFLRAAHRQLGHLFRYLPTQDALHKRRSRLSETIEGLVGVFAQRSRATPAASSPRAHSPQPSHESRRACSRSLPASASTTSSAVPAARSPTTPRSRVAPII